MRPDALPDVTVAVRQAIGIGQATGRAHGRISSPSPENGRRWAQCENTHLFDIQPGRSRSRRSRRFGCRGLAAARDTSGLRQSLAGTAGSIVHAHHEQSAQILAAANAVLAKA